jgi:hypothetical protein
MRLNSTQSKGYMMVEMKKGFSVVKNGAVFVGEMGY